MEEEVELSNAIERLFKESRSHIRIHGTLGYSGPSHIAIFDDRFPLIHDMNFLLI
ncbi:MAG: hypothetical protein ABS960_10050 [Solibacillus isronensis]